MFVTNYIMYYPRSDAITKKFLALWNDSVISQRRYASNFTGMDCKEAVNVLCGKDKLYVMLRSRYRKSYRGGILNKH